jgi:hypothetical protein
MPDMPSHRAVAPPPHAPTLPCFCCCLPPLPLLPACTHTFPPRPTPSFAGTLVVVPDVRQLYKQGAVPSAHQRSEGGAGAGAGEGFSGLKALGVRDLTYKTAFLASYVSATLGTPAAVQGRACGFVH